MNDPVAPNSRYGNLWALGDAWASNEEQTARRLAGLCTLSLKSRSLRRDSLPDLHDGATRAPLPTLILLGAYSTDDNLPGGESYQGKIGK